MSFFGSLAIGAIIAFRRAAPDPFSAGIFFLVSAFAREPTAAEERRSLERQERSYVTTAANLLMVGGILATPFFSEPIERDNARGVTHAIMLGFGVVSIGLWAHVVHGFRTRRDVRWSLGIGVVAIDFSSWVVALWFLSDPNAGW